MPGSKGNELSDTIAHFKEDPELLEIVSRAYTNTGLYGKFIYPDTFTAPIGGIYRQIYDLIDSGHNKIAIAAPRGIGKTTIARTVLSKRIHYRDLDFGVYVSNSAKFAVQQTENLKRSLIGNSLAKQLFGNIKVADIPIDMEEEFSKEAWVAYGKTLILPRGSGQQIRGLNWNDKRPQLIVVDDLENKDEVRNPEIRKAQKEWFFSDVVKSVSQFDRNWTIIYIDTLKHEDSLLQLLLDSKDWATLELSICDENLNSLMPEYMTTEEIKAEYEDHKEKGILDVFYMERMNRVYGEHSPFKAEFFKRYKESDLKNLKRIENILIVDPAKSVTPTASDSAVLCWGLDTENQRYLLRDITVDKLMPDQLYNATFDMAARWRVTAVGLEVTGLKEFILQPFKNEMFRRGATFTLVELNPRGGKEEQHKDNRIKQLSPYYRRGEIWHNEEIAHIIEGQLLPFPRSKKKDVADAAAYLLEMLEIGNRYFLPPELPEEEGEEGESEFKELERDYLEPVRGWRTV
jgi:hypothetical protein